jgi:LuxR family maltose regulon positive regulatory protein
LRGRLRRAADLARRACAVADGCGLADADLPAAIDVAHAWISTERCDIRAALAHTERATATTMISGDPVLSAALALVRARLLRMRGEFAAAREALRAERLATASTPVPGWLEQRLIAAETSLAITVGRRDTPAPESADPDTPGSPPSAIVLAWATLERHDAVQTIHHATEDLHNEVLPLDRRVDAWLLTAASHLVHDRPHLARAAIDQALRLAEPDQLRRPILEAPPTVRRLIRHDPHFADTHHWLLADDTVATRAHRPTAPTAFVMFQPLTEKENEVLHLLAALLSTEEIAKRMFISVNTVKTHVRGILRKLSAVRRNEAVRRAREFGLI